MRADVLAMVLIGSLVASVVSMEASGALNLRFEPDSFDYQAISETRLSLSQMLSARRPPVYPAILSVARDLSGSYQFLPYMQAIIFSASVLGLFWCAIMAGLQPWKAFILSFPLSQASVLTEYAGTMLPETVAASMLISVCGLSYLIAARGPSKILNGSLALSVVAGCLARPALVFLAVVSPFAILMATPSLRPMVARRQLVREATQNVLSAAGLVFTYALLRLVVVGHFGVVSYGGIALAGLGTNPAFLTSADVVHLPTDDMRDLAQSIVDRRQQLKIEAKDTVPSFIYDEEAMRNAPMLEAWTRSFDPSVWNVAIPAARDHYGVSQRNSLNPGWVLINDRLTQLSFETIRRKPRLYAEWVVRAFRASFQNAFHYERGGRGAIGLSFAALLSVLGAQSAELIIKRLRPSDRGLKRFLVSIALAAILVLAFNWEAARSISITFIAVAKGSILGTLYPLFVLFGCLAATGISVWSSITTGNNAPEGGRRPERAYAGMTLLFFSTGMLLVALVEMPLQRYIIGMSSLLPGAVLLVTIQLLRKAIGLR